MRRIAATLVLAFVALAGVFSPMLFDGSGTAAAADDPATITDYRAEFDVDVSGTLVAVETITTQIPAGRHGIFRYWDGVHPGDDRIRLTPRDIRVTVDGSAADVELLWEGGRRFRVAKIGDPDRILTPGQHVYRISYRVEGVLGPGSSPGTSAFDWDLVPAGWEMPIDRASLTVRLPSEVTTPVDCAVGGGTTGACRAVVSGDGTIHVRTGALEPRTPVTVSAGLGVPAPERETLPWSTSLDPVLGRSPLLTVILLLLAGCAAVAGAYLTRRSREAPPGLPLMYAPPVGVGPVQAAYVVDERVPDDALAATLLHQAERGLTRLTREDDDWIVEGIAEPADWHAADPVTAEVGESLGVTTPGSRFRTDGGVDAGQQLQSAAVVLEETTETWARDAGLLRRHRWELAAQVLAGVAVLAAAAGFWVNPFDVSLMGMVPAAYAIAGFPLLARGVGTRRTRAGRDLWSRAGGFERVLSTPSSIGRFDFSGREGLYTAFVPWAVAFGCAERWAEKYETETATTAPVPSWLHRGRDGTPLGSTAVMVGSFASSLAASVAAYEATQSSSSGSDGGGSSGGGGGGGSW